MPASLAPPWTAESRARSMRAMNQEGDPDGRARRRFVSGDLLRLLAVGGFANAMRWLEMLASGLFAYEVTGSGFVVAAVIAARQLPQLLLGAFAGAISEALNRKHILLFGLVASASLSAALAALAAAGMLELWHVALGNLLSGAIWSTEMSTRRRMVGESAGPSRILQAIALDSTLSAATRMVGPLLGGVAFELLGMRGAYAMTAVVQFACAALVLSLAHAQEARPLAVARIPTDILEGLAFARLKPIILLVFGVTVVTNAFGFAYSGLIAPLGRGEFGVSPTLVGLLAAGEPIGALLGGVLLASGHVRIDRRLAFAGGSLAFMLSLVAMALSPSYWLAFAILVLGGLGTAGFGNMQSTLMLTEAPPHMRSRLMGIVTVCIGTAPLGVLAAGALADAIGLRAAIVAMAATGFVLTLLLSAVLRVK
jgi:MFS family permease